MKKNYANKIGIIRNEKENYSTKKAKLDRNKSSSSSKVTNKLINIENVEPIKNISKIRIPGYFICGSKD